MKDHIVGGVMAASLGSVASTDEIQTLLVSLFALAIRELIYWWTHREQVEDKTEGG